MKNHLSARSVRIVESIPPLKSTATLHLPSTDLKEVSQVRMNKKGEHTGSEVYHEF